MSEDRLTSIRSADRDKYHRVKLFFLIINLKYNIHVRIIRAAVQLQIQLMAILSCFFEKIYTINVLT